MKPRRDAKTDASSTAPDSRLPVDPREASSRCADCKQLGHWRGDAERPKVKSGEVPKCDKKPDKQLYSVHWIRVVHEPARVSVRARARATSPTPQSSKAAKVKTKGP